MRPGLWDTYMRLQTVSAYGDKPFSGGNQQLVTSALEAVAWNGAAIAPGVPRVLVIGPSGPFEPGAIRQRFNVPVHVTVLTAHGPEAEALAAQTGESKIDCVVHADMHDIPLPEGSQDYVFSSNVLEHAFAPYIALMELRRVLRIGAEFLFILPSFEQVEGGKGPFHLHCLTLDVWAELLRKTGYSGSAAQVEGGYLRFEGRCVEMSDPHRTILGAVCDLKLPEFGRDRGCL